MSVSQSAVLIVLVTALRSEDKAQGVDDLACCYDISFIRYYIREC